MYKLYQTKINKYNFNVVLKDNYLIYLNTDFHDVYNDFKNVELVLSPNLEINNIILQLSKYFKGELTNFDFKYKLYGTNFQVNVWENLLRVPYGKFISYSELALMSNNFKGVRAVANAVGKNPLLIFVPCHRIIRKDGSIGGFSSDIKIKEHLQAIESNKVK